MGPATSQVLESNLDTQILLKMDDRIDQKVTWHSMGHVATLEWGFTWWPQILEVEVNQNVMALYDLGPGAFANSATMFKHPLAELLQMPQAYKKHWVKSANIAKTW